MIVEKQNPKLFAQIYHCTAAQSSSKVAPINWSDNKGSNAVKQVLLKLTRTIAATNSTEQETPPVNSAKKQKMLAEKEIIEPNRIILYRPILKSASQPTKGTSSKETTFDILKNCKFT